MKFVIVFRPNSENLARGYLKSLWKLYSKYGLSWNFLLIRNSSLRSLSIFTQFTIVLDLMHCFDKSFSSRWENSSEFSLDLEVPSIKSEICNIVYKKSEIFVKSGKICKLFQNYLFFWQEKAWYFWKMESFSNTWNRLKNLNFATIWGLPTPGPPADPKHKERKLVIGKTR